MLEKLRVHRKFKIVVSAIVQCSANPSACCGAKWAVEGSFNLLHPLATDDRTNDISIHYDGAESALPDKH